MAYKNNLHSIDCSPEECIVAGIEQIGPQQAWMDGPYLYAIKRWTDDGEVVAELRAPCGRVTITLDRRTESVLWVEVPINPTEIYCKNADTSIRKATLETSLYQQKMLERRLGAPPPK
jgi:hypothetical protein